MSSVRSISFFRLWSGNTASGIATWALPFVLGFAVADAVLSTVELGILLALRSAGFLAAVPVAGVMADRVGSRRIILVSSLIAACGAALIFIDLAGDMRPFSILTAAGVVLSGMGQGACRPVYQSIVPVFVPETDLQIANAALSFSVRATILVGPAAATIVATMFGLEADFLSIGLLWMISALLPPWPAEPHGETGRTVAGTGLAVRFVADLLKGYHEARRHPWFFAALAALSAVVATGYSVTGVLVPLISMTVYNNASLLTGSVTAYMSGALLGGVAISYWKPVKRGWWALAGLGAYSIVPLSLLMPEIFWIPMAAYVIAGFGMELFNVIWFTAIQGEIERRKLARVSSLDFIVSYGLAPLGLAAVAPLSQGVGMMPVLVATAIICVLAACLAAAVPTAPEFRMNRV
ncbi:MFS transporter [Brucella pituitosa]|uniref:MFS transporter n=1 Tax=Brucella pituitosa TaxID=571256 RepID=UPI0020034B7E|nr:MFS transporter [Brucella pituitosa]MCK4207524.1 MFS transporter [Brucella pituitosa]